MERLSELDKVAAIDLDSYLEALPMPESVEGRLLDDATHAFYFWLSKYKPQVGVVDGVTLEALYLKNVVDGDMTEMDFVQYCENNQLPVPPTYIEADRFGYFEHEFMAYMHQQKQLQDAQYEAWAEDHGIATTPGSIMRFLDSEGNEYRVRTDTANRGQIIA
jgi:hypothetical protein